MHRLSSAGPSVLLFAFLALEFVRLSFAFAEGERAQPLPDASVARATGDIVEAVLVGPTARYRHFVLGSRHEASGVRIRTAAGRSLELMLPDDSVFEDREPRIVDLDGDGRNEILLVHSRQDTGSALAVLGLRDGALRIIAETPGNGGPQRWLNPAGTGHFFDRKGLQIALVRMPHAVGRLEFWGFDGAALRLLGSLPDISNHRIGSRNQLMSAVILGIGHALDTLAVPAFDRRSVRFATVRDGAPVVASSVALRGQADGNFHFTESWPATLRIPIAGGGVQTIDLGDQSFPRPDLHPR